MIVDTSWRPATPPASVTCGDTQTSSSSPSSPGLEKEEPLEQSVCTPWLRSAATGCHKQSQTVISDLSVQTSCLWTFQTTKDFHREILLKKLLKWIDNVLLWCIMVLVNKIMINPALSVYTMRLHLIVKSPRLCLSFILSFCHSSQIFLNSVRQAPACRNASVLNLLNNAVCLVVRYLQLGKGLLPDINAVGWLTSLAKFVSSLRDNLFKLQVWLIWYQGMSGQVLVLTWGLSGTYLARIPG